MPDSGHRFLSQDPLGETAAPVPETPGEYLDRCGFLDTVFVIGLALSIAGFWFLAPNVEDIANQITGTSWVFDIVGATQDFSHIVSYVGFLFDFLWFLFTNFLLGMFPWWEQVGETIMLTADLTLPVFILNLIGTVAIALIGYESLVSANCAPQI